MKIETRKKISETLKRIGIKPPDRTGCKMPKSAKLAISLALKGRPAHNKSVPHSKEHIHKISGENNWNWKGGVSYIYTIHKWVKALKGRAKDYTCEFCRKNKAYDWSNIDHKYRKKLEDYRALCRGCHNKWDMQFNGRRKNQFDKRYDTKAKKN